MTSTSDVNLINLQVIAEDQIAIDKANGTYDANRASDSKYYLWQSEFQTIPVGMDGNPEQFAARLRDALPQVTTLRMPFNEHSFNDDGTLHPQYDRFLQAAAAEGFQILFVYCGGDVQRAGDTATSADDLYAALDGEIFDGMLQGWDAMLSWLDANPAVQNAVYGLEIANEPESYSVGGDMDGAGSTRCHELYAAHVAELGARIDAAIDAAILVGGWRYSARFDELDTGDVNGQSVIDAIREAIGDDLVWSSHLYPGWIGRDDATPEELEETFQDHYAAVLGDAILLTETNAPGSVVDNVDARDQPHYIFPRAYEWFAENGIGLGWFPGAEVGASNFVVIDGNGGLRFLHQSSLAHGMNAFSLGDDPVEHALDEVLQTVLVPGRVRNEAYQPEGVSFDDTDGIAYGFGYGGNDTITGQDRANDLIYGGAGNDALDGGANDDHLFGQGDHDTLRGGAGDDHLFGGDGDDLLDAGSGFDQLTGGAGADLFLFGAGHTDILDFDWTQGDRASFGAADLALLDILAGATIDADDVRIDFGVGTVTFRDFLRINADAIQDLIFGPNADPSIVTGTGDADMIGAGNMDVPGRGTSDQADLIVAGDGDDTVHAGAGADTLLGGGGNDMLYGGDGGDLIIAGANAGPADVFQFHAAPSMSHPVEADMLEKKDDVPPTDLAIRMDEGYAFDAMIPLESGPLYSDGEVFF